MTKRLTGSIGRLILPFLTIISIIILTAQCSPGGSADGVTNITVNYNLNNVKPFEKAPYEVSYEIIPLLLPQYENIRIFINNIEVYDGKIYISTLRESILIFDTNGNFINKIPKGDQLTELQAMVDFMVNRKENKLEVFDVKRVSEFDLSGRFLASNELDGITGTEYGIAGNNRFFLRHKNSLSDYSFTINPGNRDFEWRTGQTVANILNPKHFHTYDNTLYFTGYTDKVYSMGANDSIPKLVAVVKNMNKDSNFRGLDNDRFQILSAQKKLFTYINNFFVYNPQLWAFTLHAGELGEKIFMDLESGNYYSHPLTGIPYSQNNRWVEDGAEYYLFPSAKFSEETSAKINEIAPDLYKAMEAAPADSKMWVIKATYTKKQ